MFFEKISKECLEAFSAVVTKPPPLSARFEIFAYMENRFPESILSQWLPTVVAYCGTPPSPAEIWTRWRLDPIVLFALVAAALAYVHIARRVAASRRGTELRTAGIAFAIGWVTTTLALVSPLCPLSVSLFTARATQHMVLTMFAAPLIAFALRSIAPTRARAPTFARNVAGSSLAAAFVFAAIVWFWHTPVAYEWTFDSVAAYWMMHVSMFASACWLWDRLLDTDRRPVEGLLASLLSTVQMGFLGALITLSPRAFYGPHFMTTAAWGLTPLQDQEAGGIVMWVLGCVAFLLVTIGTFARLVRARSEGTFQSAEQRA